ncbi:DUF6296 family protein [Kitasatospora sp. NPDC101235]|uniref:DUF6296 family protein n=1 Tax=Streptomycetaceae TaxID=2062 RepID=UPI001CCA1DF9|nr:DUF6296 family protein [Streptomyces sp. LS1784]
MAATSRPDGTASGYVLWLRSPSGAFSVLPVAATGRLGPAGHPLYTGCDGQLLVEITAEGRHRALARPADARILTAAPCS